MILEYDVLGLGFTAECIGLTVEFIGLIGWTVEFEGLVGLMLTPETPGRYDEVSFTRDG